MKTDLANASHPTIRRLAVAALTLVIAGVIAAPVVSSARSDGQSEGLLAKATGVIGGSASTSTTKPAAPTSSESGSTSVTPMALFPLTPPTTTSPPPPPPPAQPPPVGSTSWEAESLASIGGIVNDPSANGGQAALSTVSVTPSKAAGTYMLQARVRSTNGGRVDLLSGGTMVGSYGVDGNWRTVNAVLMADGGSVGVTSMTSGVLVDWLALSPVGATYTTHGNTIRDTSGADFVPRGVNLPYLLPNAKNNNDQFLIPEPQAPYVARWGASAGRLVLSQELWLANCPTYADGVVKSYQQAVIDEVAGLTSRGVYAILSLSSTERGEATGCAPPKGLLLKEMADTRSPAFWYGVASTFAGNPLVGFDLFNEPHDISDAVWRYGGTITYKAATILAGNKTYQAVGMQTLYDTVRSTGARNLVFVAGLSWASDPRVILRLPLDGYGIVVSSHTYCKGPEGCYEGSPHLYPGIDTLNDPAVLARHPFVLTESGWQWSWDSRYNRQLINWAEAKGIGWQIFGWAHETNPYTLLANWAATLAVGNGESTKPPANSGAPVWNALSAIRQSRGYAAIPVPEVP